MPTYNPNDPSTWGAVTGTDPNGQSTYANQPTATPSSGISGYQPVATPAAKPAANGSSQIDWSKTGWNVGTGSGSQWYTPPENDYGFQIGGNAGYFDPQTGQITYGTKSSVAPGQEGNAPIGYQNTLGNVQTYQYDVNADYGLGSTALGIIPLERNAQGQVTQFFAPTATGGYQAFSNLADAQASVSAYNTWKQTTAKATPQPASSTPATTTSSTTSSQPTGILTVPGAGENYYDSTKDLYTNGKTNAQTVFDQTSNQPTNSQQQWNAYSGIYSNPDYLNDYYGRQEQAAELTAARTQASAGIADTGAAAKTLANLPAVYGDKAIAGMNQFATTGQQMAGAADSANNSQLQTRASLGNAADPQNLSKVTAGQTAANSAESQMITRETGGLTSATTLANDQATLVSAGLSAADAQTYSSQLAGLQLQVQQGQLTAQQAYTQAQNLASTMGVVGSTALNAYLLSKLGGTSSAGYTPSIAYGTGSSLGGGST